jgi:predicted AlkP superfamily phosphohydrolase/phosphomutase
VASAAGVLYLAFDACDREIVRTMAAAGELPTFRHLFDSAAIVPVEPPPGAFVSATWPSFTTSRQPDRHGYLCWVEITPGTYEWNETTPASVKGRQFWEQLSDHGRRVAVLDVPHSRLSVGMNGVHLNEWGCHDRHFGTASWPASLVDELDELVGTHPIGTMQTQRTSNFAPCDFAHRQGEHRTHDEAATLFDDLQLGVARKEAASLELLSRGGWDLFVSIFGEGHCTGHQLWHVHDDLHPRHDPALVARIGDPLAEMYRRFDAVLAAHLQAVGDQAAVYVHLSHGMGPHYEATHLLDIVLRRLDRHEPDGRGRRSRLAATALGSLPPRWQVRALGALAPAMRRRVDRSPPGANAPSTVPQAERTWFEAPNNTPIAGIRINVRGREPHGVVEPGVEFDATCERLRRWLLEIVNVDTGEPIVREVTRSDEHYSRRPDDTMPDLFVRWNNASPIERVYSPRIGTVVEPYRDWRTGDHIPHGLLFAAGPGIAPGWRDEPIRMVDVSASLAGATGVELADVDGRSVPDLLPVPHGRSPVQPRRKLPLASTRRAAPDATAVPDRLARKAITIDRLAVEHHRTRRLAERLGDSLAWVRDAVVGQGRVLDAHAERITSLERSASVRTVMDWISHVDVAETLKVSIVLPTRNRSDVLPRAIASVLAQSYPRWELVVVDDASTDDTPKVLHELDDARLVVVHGEGRGVCAARNLALEAVTGEVVVYLDDDNMLHPDWCKSVVWAFGQRPDADVVYGARVIDDILVAQGKGSGAVPFLHFEPFDRDRLTSDNFTDIGVLAHRAGMAEARFDEQLVQYGDWDLFWRLTRREAPLELPAIACLYTTTSAGRLSQGGDRDEEKALVRAKFQALLTGAGASGERPRPI